MKAVVYSTKKFEKEFLTRANNKRHDLFFMTNRLSESTVDYAKGKDAVILFSGDVCNEKVIEKLAEYKIKYINIRSSGYDNIDLKAAEKHGIHVANVTQFSPFAIAEHTIMLMLSLSRKLLPSYKQIHDYNFNVDKLLGSDLHTKTVGIIGLGNVGSSVAQVLNAFGCQILAYDTVMKKNLARKFHFNYVDFKTLLKESDIISLHVPLNEATHHLINEEAISEMKDGVMLINTARGGVVKTTAAIEGILSGKIGSMGLDVYENESGLFFEDHSNDTRRDELMVKLLGLKNVIVTGHQAFLTEKSLSILAEYTIQNLDLWQNAQESTNELIHYTMKSKPKKDLITL